MNRLVDRRPAILRLFPRLFRLSGDQAGIGGDLFDPGRHFLDDGGSIRCGRQLGIGAGGHFGHGHRHLVGSLRGLLGACRQLFTGGGQLFGVRIDLPDQFAQIMGHLHDFIGQLADFILGCDAVASLAQIAGRHFFHIGHDGFQRPNDAAGGENPDQDANQHR